MLMVLGAASACTDVSSTTDPAGDRRITSADSASRNIEEGGIEWVEVNGQYYPLEGSRTQIYDAKSLIIVNGSQASYRASHWGYFDGTRTTLSWSYVTDDGRGSSG